MFERSIRIFWSIIALIVAVLGGELLYGYRYLAPDAEALRTKKAAVRLIGLPDLAVATEARFLRFRSLADVYSPFNEGPELLDHFPASFVFAPSPVERKIPNRIERP